MVEYLGEGRPKKNRKTHPRIPRKKISLRITMLIFVSFFSERGDLGIN